MQIPPGPKKTEQSPSRPQFWSDFQLVWFIQKISHSWPLIRKITLIVQFSAEILRLQRGMAKKGKNALFWPFLGPQNDSIDSMGLKCVFITYQRSFFHIWKFQNAPVKIKNRVCEGGQYGSSEEGRTPPSCRPRRVIFSNFAHRVETCRNVKLSEIK